MKALLLLVSTTASAAQYHAQGTTTLDLYQLRRFGAEDDERLQRLRWSQSADLVLWDLFSQTRPGSWPPETSAALSLRVFGDAGSYANTEATDAIPEMERTSVDVLYAYAEVRDVAHILDLRLGRQLLFDEVEMALLDGAWWRLRSPWALTLEGWAGVRPPAERALASSTFALDGTAPPPAGLADPFSPTDEWQRFSIALGGALALDLWPWVYARASYRRVSSTASVTPFSADAEMPESREISGLDQEKVALRAAASLWQERLFLSALAIYDLLLARPNELGAGLRFQLTPKMALTGEARTVNPSFDGDSIFNIFSTDPFQEGRVSSDFELRGHIRMSIAGYAKFFSYEYDPGDAQAFDGTTSGGAFATARLDRPRWFGRIDAQFEDGFGGLLAGGGITVGKSVLAKRLQAEGRLELLQFDNTLQESQSGLLFGSQARVVYRLWRQWNLTLWLEDNTNRFQENSLRVLVALELAEGTR